MKRILVIFTGGTIGSKTSGAAIDVDSEISYELIRRYEDQSSSHPRVKFTAVQPFTILSENMLPQDWETLCHTIEREDPAKYDGIIITHGSDTLAYTAAAISYRFADTPIPILLTASNYPLDDPRSEGVRNFTACVEMIVHDPLPGIFVVFEDHTQRMLVHLGTRIRQSQPFTDRFISIYDMPYGQIVDGRLQLHGAEINPGLQLVRDHERRKFALDRVSFSGDILCLRPYPGFRYSYLSLASMSRKPQAVLLELYHSGTTGIRFMEEEDSLLAFIEDCADEGIPVYITPLKRDPERDGLYASSHELLGYGAVPLANISVEAALVKLMLAYGSLTDHRQIEMILQRNLFFEFTE